MTVALGGIALPLDPSQLQATEAGATPDLLTFTVNALPTLGVLKKGGSALAVGGTFTQGDLNNGLLTFQNTNVAGASPNGVTDSFAFTVTGLNNVSLSQQKFVISFGHVQSVSDVHDSTGTVEFVLFKDGTVYRGPGSPNLAPVTSAATLAISAGLDRAGAADVTVQFASDRSLWTHTGTNQLTGWTKLVFTTEAARGATARSFVAGPNGVVDVVFSDNTLWQASLAHPTTPTQVTKNGVALTNVKLVAIGEHNGGEADFIAFNDSGASNGGVLERYGPLGSGSTWVKVTSRDAYAISASWDRSDTADLVVSSRNAPGVTDHSAYAWRGTPNSLSLITSLAVSSVSVNALGNDFYVLQSTGSLYEHLNNDPSTTVTVLVTSPPVPVTLVLAPNGDTDLVDFLFANGTLWNVTGLTSVGPPNPKLLYHHVAN
jgi:hypothetical protein